MDNYIEIARKLKESFPSGTVQFTNSKRAYIPNQVYTDRLESATQSQWSRHIKELDINVDHKYVKAIVTITIGEYLREGYGIAVIKGNPGESPAEIEKAVDQAVNSAFIEALDSYQMGWVDLAPYKKSEKEWGSNPGLAHLLQTDNSGSNVVTSPIAISTHVCLKCNSPLKHAEWELLEHVPKLNRNKMVYCYNDIPPHYKRTIPEDKLNTFLSVMSKD